jgi:hypothetical protein
MTKEELAALLGRPLTSNEDTNFDTYIDIATLKLESLLCTHIGTSGGGVYESREGYSTVFTDIFNVLEYVSVDGETADPADYYPAFFGQRNSAYYNSIVFKDKFAKSVLIEPVGTYGFAEQDGIPSDLGQVLSKLFVQVAKGSANDRLVSSKRVEDFSISFADEATTNEEALSNANRMTLAKYSLCSVGNIRHGEVS